MNKDKFTENILKNEMKSFMLYAHSWIMYNVITLVLWLPQDVQMIINLILGCVDICFFSTLRMKKRAKTGWLSSQDNVVVSLRFWVEGFFFRIGGKWSERSEPPFRQGVRGPSRPPEADDKMMQNPGIWAFPGS